MNIDGHGAEDRAHAGADFAPPDAVGAEACALSGPACTAAVVPDRAGGNGAGRLRLLLARFAGATRITAGDIDRSSLVAALVGGAAYLLLAWLSHMIVQEDPAMCPVWLPNAFAVAVLLRVRLGNEWPFLLACCAASLAADSLMELPGRISLLVAIANVAEIAVVLALTRKTDGRVVQMDRIGDLARFVWAGGLVGPLVAAVLILPEGGAGLADLGAGVVARFLTASMAMVLIVPAALLLIDRIRGTLPPSPADAAEQVALLAGGTASAFLVFNQNAYPLLFLIQPIILLHAFRVGSLGSALHVGAVAVVAGAMTYAGRGPIAAASGGSIAELHLLQAFIAANFLTGLPVAAILAGRDRIMARLDAGKREIDILAENISDAILRFDLDGNCTYASPSVREVLGAEPDSLIGAHATSRLRPEARAQGREALTRLLGGESERERLTYRRLADAPDGSPVFIEADGAVVCNPLTGARDGVVIAARDVTERVELQMLLTRARHNAEAAGRAKSEFLANMSHEIRTPMNGVLGFAELMLQGELDADQRRFAELIVRSGRSMMTLLNDVLDLAKIESGQFTIDRAPVDLAACIGECAALHRAAAERKGLALELAWDGAPDSDDAPRVLTDGLRLRQILLNLIGNAVKFTATGHISVGYRIEADEVRVTVKDSGIGISPLQLEAIFQPFTQGETDTARRFGGTGLGLSISRQLAALLGGRIDVESKPGAGSRFTLVLPATLAPTLPEPAAEADAPDCYLAPASMPDLLGASRILLVEDHDINRILVTEMLERCGQEVAVAHDGNEAIAMVIDSIMRARPYDLVLMDVQMPGCDGLTATRAIRAEGIGPALLPVIALTANAYPEDVAAARDAGMQAHLAKPVVLPQLARALQRWLPTRIVEDERSAACVSALARSPRLVERWEARRSETLAAVRRALAEGWLGEAQSADPVRRGELAGLLHKLAGTAGLFDEPALGEAAGALERALTAGAPSSGSAALAEALLHLAAAPDAVQAPGPARG